ncbi:hypothetical protein GS429_08520 [Natronorubrum sp. JWXQ-INN-674]|uniref:Uncharacterized protein n=1 Tax=Natronorubrum halalkaliphilum TaxID=2691917 RepID=A0A6B0VLL9_9EURY|nr:hypothetical protein [Natronorubrum halalkaliphilum]MXV62103.1 hypothetical protein [Natronorubrum halalkaliphilum]
MSTGVPREGQPQSQVPYIRRNATLLQDLPEPGEQWRSKAISDELANRLVGLQNRGIVQRVDRIKCEEWSKRRCIWQTDRDAYGRIQTVLEEGDDNALLPCGHSAISNERDVDGVSCGVCGEVHDREEVDSR